MAKILVVKDRCGRFHTVQSDIDKLKDELLRVSRLTNVEKKEMDRVRQVDQQLQYLEELLAAFERDQKKKFD